MLKNTLKCRRRCVSSEFGPSPKMVGVTVWKYLVGLRLYPKSKRKGPIGVL